MENFSRIDLTGNDIREYAQRLWSRDFRSVPVGEGRFTLFLSAEGKIQAAFWALIESESHWILLTEPSLQQRTFEQIEKYHFAERFSAEQKPEPISFQVQAQTNLSTSGSAVKNAHAHWQMMFRGLRFDLTTAGKSPSSSLSEETRINHLLPEWGKDYDESTLVFDVGFDEFCDLGKGCYSGQEVVERVRTRAGTGPFYMALVEGEVTDPASIQPNTPLYMDSKAVGYLSLSIVKNEGSFQALSFLNKNVPVEATLSLSASSEQKNVVRITKSTRQNLNAK